MKQNMSTNRRGLAILLVAAVLIVAILAGHIVMRNSDADFAVKPATGSAQAMAEAGTIDDGAGKPRR